MSEKKAKQDRKLKVMTEEADNLEVAKNMAASIRKMYEDRDAKALAAKERLVSQLKITSDKYMTGNGVMSALETVRLVVDKYEDDIFNEISNAKTLAMVMADKAARMAEKAEELNPDEMDKLCDGFYIVDFAATDGSMLDLMEELMSLQLCQNVGPSAEDVVEFLNHTDEEIKKAKKNLEDFCNEHKLNYLEVCGEKKDDLDKLCDACGNASCHNGGNKFIKVGQSAYDVCEDFVE